ncbi:MAG: hypothetical protein ACK50N_01335 [Flavobacteriales bacterium]|jgi:hypothetical protein
MKHLATLFLLTFSFACKSPSTATTSDDTNKRGSLVTVSSALEKEGCPWILRMESEAGIQLFEPVALEEAYRKDGLRLRIEYRTSRQASHCPNTTPVVIEWASIDE